MSDFIWTNHALERAKQRGVTDDEVWLTLRSPDHSQHASTKGAFEFVKTYHNKKISVVAAKNSEGRWVVMSCWGDPIWGAQAARPYRGGGWFDRLLESALQKLFGKFQRRK